MTKKAKAASCTACKMTPNAKFCPTHWFFKLFVINAEQPNTKLSLNVFEQQVVNKVLALCDLTEDATEDDLKDAVIDLGLVSISYDGHSKQLISIEQIKI